MRQEELEVPTEDVEEEEVTDDGVEVSSDPVVEADSHHVMEDTPDEPAEISSPEANGEKRLKNVRNERDRPKCKGLRVDTLCQA
jgi:hypothetical protein